MGALVFLILLSWLRPQSANSNPSFLIAFAHWHCAGGLCVGSPCLGAVYLEEGRFDAAIEAFKKAIAIDENFVQAYTRLGVAYVEQDRAAEAIAPLRRAIGINPDSAEVYYYLADAFSVEDERALSLESL